MIYQETAIRSIWEIYSIGIANDENVSTNTDTVTANCTETVEMPRLLCLRQVRNLLN